MLNEVKIQMHKVGPVADDQAIVIDVDMGDLSAHLCPQYMSRIAKAFREAFPDVKAVLKGKNTAMHIRSRVAIASDLLNIREPVLRLATVMEQKLRVHDDDRGERGWANDEPMALFHRIKDEMEELLPLLVECKDCVPADFERLADRAILECADVAAFPMMIADILEEAKRAGE